MILKDIQDIFHNELDAIYGPSEVGSFFNILIDYYLGLNRVALVIDPKITVTKTDEQYLFEALSRLKQEEPIQYIIGETEFFGLTFKVSENTLIPRPETEALVAWVLNEFKERRDAKLKILDIGTGTGCIAVSLAKHLPNASIYALDVSLDALNIAKQNAKANNVTITCIHDDILKTKNNALLTESDSFDIIISNPPYVRELEKVDIKKNVLNFEPHLALFVNNDNPLQFYRAIANFAIKKLKPEGVLFFEINQYLGQETKALLESYPYKDVVLKNDIFKNPRMLKGTK